MNEIKENIHAILTGDSTLTNMLASNKPFNKPSRASSKANSVLPWGKATQSTNSPFVSVQGGPETRISDRFYTDLVYIKVYNGDNKTYVTIDNIVSRIVALLHLQQLGLTNGVAVKTVRESVTAELWDEGLKMNYKEITFRVYML
jgi:hypothetical protein